MVVVGVLVLAGIGAIVRSSKPSNPQLAERGGGQIRAVETYRRRDPDPEPKRVPPKEPTKNHREDLRKGSAQARVDAATALGRLGPDAIDAVPDLIVAAGDQDVGVRLAAVKSLGQIGGGAKAAISNLVGNLIDSSPEVQLAAVDALEAIGLPARGDIRVLKAAAESKNSRVRQYVVAVLGKIKCDPQDVLPVVMFAIKDKDKSVRLAAIQTWGKIGSDDKKAALAGLLAVLKESTDVAETKACVEALDSLGPLTATEVPALEVALKEKSPTLRLFAVNSLGRIGQDAKLAVLPLRQALKDEDAAVRQAAIVALGNIGQAANTARPDLVEALKSKDHRVVAADALLRTGPDAGLGPTWIGLLKDDDEEIVSIAIKAIDQLGKLRKDNALALIDALKSNKVAVRACAATALGNMGPDAGLAVLDLIKTLQDKNVDVQKSVISALGKIGPEAGLASPQLINALKDKNLRDTAFEALVKIGKGAVPDLVQTLKVDDAKQPQKLDVIGILKEIGPDAKAAVKVLAGITKSFDELPSVRKAAKAALDKIESK